FHPAKVSELVEQALSSVADRIKDRKILIEKDVSSDIPLVYVDQKKLQFAVQMVLENAIIYSPEKGTIRILAETIGGYVFLSIRDHGIGISKEDLEHVFSKFFRSKNAMHSHTEGLGIGLYLSRDIMQRHGGSLTAESEGQGMGSTFRFGCER